MPQQLAALITIAATGVIAAQRFVTPAGAQAGAAANTLGVSPEAAVAGDLIAVQTRDVADVTAGAAVAVGAAIETDATGRAVTKAAGPTVGRALTAAANAGEVIEVLLIPN
jgi:hypothetical protein